MNKFKVWYKNPYGKHEFVGSYTKGITLDPCSGQIYCNGINVTEYYDLLKYTGFKDKNGNEIYEGYICKCIDKCGEEYITTVSYNGGAFCVDVNSGDYDFTAIGWALENDIREIEVIGNIYENPELMEG